ncbi:MAG: helix-turn-helix transcriptional regulator [Rickettsia sp.]
MQINIKLSEREHQLITLLANHYSLREISTMLSEYENKRITVMSLQKTLANAKLKLGTNMMHETIRKAISLELNNYIFGKVE